MNCLFRKARQIYLLFFIVILGCTKGLEPIPTTTDISMSWSLPVGYSKVSFEKTLETLDIPLIYFDNVDTLLKYEYFYMRDTLPLNLSEIYDRDYPITLLSFRVNVWNQFPVGGKTRIAFLDSDNNVIDLLWYDQYFIIGPGNVANNGTVIDAAYGQTTIDFDNQRIDNLREARNLVIEAGIVFDDPDISVQKVEYFLNYYLKIQIGVRVDFNIEDI